MKVRCVSVCVCLSEAAYAWHVEVLYTGFSGSLIWPGTHQARLHDWQSQGCVSLLPSAGLQASTTSPSVYPGSWHWTQVPILSTQAFYQLGHLPSPKAFSLQQTS